ncbi:hypothetical protein GCM10010468_48500 [Actinocorallia longicatena]|uniref:Protein kinase domain-containing protein n=2 Tax=Actinocorallia longicatena TaxID=111803 RepID=A0ABP6QGJ9_9ACTN
MPEAEPLRPGDPGQIGPFRLMGRLGEGGQGVVFQGLSESGEPVAVKLLHTRFTGNPRARGAFAYELAAAQKVDPFCTARILAADVEGDIPYIASEYIHGLSLKRTVAEWGPREGSQLNRLAIGTATALVAIHKAGVVHRDFKPSNVLLGPDGPRVIDFGVARALDLTTSSISSGGPVGTPAYMAPEQFARAPVSTAVDVFAWASTLVYASCGQPPFGNDSISVVINRILNEQPELGRLAGGLRELAAACLHKNPAARPSADQLLLDLIGSGASADDPIGSQPSRDPGYRGRGRRAKPAPPSPYDSGASLPVEPRLGPAAPRPAFDPGTGPSAARSFGQEPPRPAFDPGRGPGENTYGRGRRRMEDQPTGGRAPHDPSFGPGGGRPADPGFGSGRAGGQGPFGDGGALGGGPEGSFGTGTHPAVSRLELRAMQRARRRRATTRNGTFAGVAGLLAVAGLAAFLLWPGGEKTGSTPSDQKTVVNTGTATSAAAPPAGTPLSLTNTDLHSYTMAAVKAGVEENDGKKYPYIEYVLTNVTAQPVPIEEVGDLFVRTDQVEDKSVGCMEQAGADKAFCSVKNRTVVKAYLDKAGPPVIVDGVEAMPGGASYLLRVSGDRPVEDGIDPAEDLKLYVWDVRFFKDREAREVVLP